MTESTNEPESSPENPYTEQLDAGHPPHSEPLEKHKWNMTYDLVIPIVLLLIGGGFVIVRGSVAPEKRPPTDMTRSGRLKALPPVRVERLRSLESTGQQLQLIVDGNVVPYRESRVAAEIAGRVIYKSDSCEAGTYVKKDEVLMRIDPTDYELEVQRLTRLREQEYEALGEVDQEMANAKRLIGVAEKDVELQQKEVDRLKALPAQFASPAEIDQANRALLAATQQLVSVENQLDLLRQRRVRLESSEELAKTQLKLAEVNLARTEITAPIDGVIVNEDADLNTFVARGSTLVTIEDTSKVEVATNLRMDQLYWVLDQEGEQLDPSVRGYNLPETPAIIEYELSGRQGSVYRWRGRLLRYDGIGLDPVSRTVPVRVVVDNPNQYATPTGESQRSRGPTALVRGMFVRVKLLIEPQTRLVVIPARALQPGNRVLQFIPDESVLKLQTREVVDSDVGSGDPNADAKNSGEPSGGGFKEGQWEPGYVMVRQSVNPVDSLSIEADLTSAIHPDSGFAVGNRHWVCESQDPSLQGGSFVVVSPLGSIDEGQIIDEGDLAVRAERTGMKEAPTFNASRAKTAGEDTKIQKGDVESEEAS